jgi:hypothetical protein
MKLVYSSSTAKVNNTGQVVHGSKSGNSETLKSRCMVSSADDTMTSSHWRTLKAAVENLL